MTHVQLPHLYITSNWPLQHVALSESGADIAVAGRRGLALYNRPTEKWVHARGQTPPGHDSRPRGPLSAPLAHTPWAHPLTRWSGVWVCGIISPWHYLP